METNRSSSSHGVQIMIIFALFGATLFCLHSISDVFTPLFLALTLVLTMLPITRWLRAHRVPGWLAATVSFLVLAGLFGALVWIMVWAFTPVPQALVNYSGNFEEALDTALNFLQSKGMHTQNLSAYINQLNFNSVIAWVWGLVDSLRSIGGLLAIVVIALLFIIVDTTTLTARSVILRKRHSHIANALLEFEKRVRNYWLIATIFGLIVAVIDVFALNFLGVPLAVTWGLWAFITNYIPNIGFVLGVIPPMIMGLADSGWQTMIWVMVLYSVINVLIQTFIQPKFTGDVVGLSPTVTFISLVLWTSVVGWLGSLLAVPLTLFFKALLIDSDPRTQWIDVFLVSESEAKRRNDAGRYDDDHVDDAQELEFHFPSHVLPKISLPHTWENSDEESDTATVASQTKPRGNRAIVRRVSNLYKKSVLLRRSNRRKIEKEEVREQHADTELKDTERNGTSSTSRS